LLVLDELWSLLRDPGLASLIEEIARIGRHHYLSLWIASQQVQELLTSDQGLAVLNNSAIKVYLKQNGPDGDLLADKVRLSSEARRFLRSAARGQALLDVSGMVVPVDIQASKEDHELITTDPRERRASVR
jgi:type IV secretory pathway VirB4 component